MPRFRRFPLAKATIALVIAALCAAPAAASAAYLTTPRARHASVTVMQRAWGGNARVYVEGCHRSNASHVNCVVAAKWPNADKDDSFGACRVWVTLAGGALIVHPVWDGREEVIDVDD